MGSLWQVSSVISVCIMKERKLYLFVLRNIFLAAVVSLGAVWDGMGVTWLVICTGMLAGFTGRFGRKAN